MKTWTRVVAPTIAGIALVGTAYAQVVVPVPETRPTPDPPPSHTTEVRGHVKSVEDNVLTLTDGHRLIVLPGITTQQGELKPGAKVRASYAETAGRKVATSIRVDPM